MKARLTLVVLSIVCVCSLTTCGTPAGETPVTVTYACVSWLCSDMEPMAKAFMDEHPGIAIVLVPFRDLLDPELDEFGPELVTTLAAAVDSFDYFPDAIEYPLSPDGVVLPLEPLLGDEAGQVLADFPEPLLDAFRRNGRLYALPREVNPVVVYYDPAAFDDSGLPRPRIGWTWDEFLQAASALTERQGDQVTRYGFADPFPGDTLAALASQRVDTLVDTERDPPELYLDQPAVGEALSWYGDLMGRYGVMVPNTGVDTGARLEALSATDAAIEAGKAAMWLGQATEWAKYHGSGAMVAPLPENGRGSGTLYASGYFISAGTAHPDASWLWIEYLSRQAPPSGVRSLVPARASARWPQWEALDAEARQVLQYAVDHSEFHTTPVLVALNRALASYWAGAAVTEALATGQSLGEQLLAEEAGSAVAASTVAPVPTTSPVSTVAADAVRFRLISSADREPYEGLASRYSAANGGDAVALIVPDASTNWSSLTSLDCFAYPAAWLQAKGTAGLLSLDSLIDGGGLDVTGFAPGTLRAVQVDGRTWGLPLGVDPQLLYYNKPLFDAAGVSYPTTNWTVDDFVAAATALSDPSVPTYGFYPRDGAYRHIAGYLTWFGASLFAADGMPTFGDASVVAATASYAEFVRTTMPPAALEVENRFGDDTVTAGLQPGPVAGGDVSMWLDFPYNQAHSPRLDFAVGVAPTPRGAVPLSGLSVRALFVSAEARDPGACWRWLTFLTMQPEATTLLPASIAVAESDAWEQSVGEETAMAWRALIDGGLEPPAEDPIATRAAYWLGEALEAVLEGAKPEQALAEAQTRAAAYASCMLSRDEAARWERATQSACAHQADPDVRLAE